MKAIPLISDVATEKQVTREELERALSKTFNYHGIDAKLGTADHRLAKMMMPQLWRALFKETEVDLIEKMSPAERSRIGREDT